MKNFKIPIKYFLSISNDKHQTPIINKSNIIIGQYKNRESRGILEFDINPRIFDFKIVSAELVFYLTDTNIDLNVEAFMLNISRNLEFICSEYTTWENAPRFFQEANFSKINSNFSKNYMRIDISKFLEFSIKKRISKFGLTLLGLSHQSLVYLSNIPNRKPYIDINVTSTDNTLPINNECLDSKNHNGYYYQNASTSEFNQHIDNYYNDNFYNMDTIHQNSKSISNDQINHKHTSQFVTSDKTSQNLPTHFKEAFGNFVSFEGTCDYLNEMSYIKFDTEIISERTNLTLKKDGIFILYKGSYKIDYMVNCRADNFATMELELDGKPLPSTTIQISNADSITTGSTIISLPENNMILKVKLSTINAILINTGICASINLYRIK